MIVVVAESDPLRAVIVTFAVAETANVVAVKPAIVWPEATVTAEGTVTTAVLPLSRVTTVPGAGAAAPSATKPLAGDPPVTEAGLTPTASGAAVGETAGVGVAVGVTVGVGVKVAVVVTVGVGVGVAVGVTVGVAVEVTV